MSGANSPLLASVISTLLGAMRSRQHRNSLMRRDGQQRDLASDRRPAETMAAVDIGSDFSSIWNPADGSILAEPSVVGLDSTGKAQAFGLEASLGKSRWGGDLTIHRPFADGIVDGLARKYLDWLFDRAGFRGIESVPVFLPVHMDSPLETGLSDLVAEMGGDPLVIHRPLAAAVSLDVANTDALTHLMVEVWDDGAEVAVVRGGSVTHSEPVYTGTGELVVAAIDGAIDTLAPDAEAEVRAAGVHVYGWAAQQDGLARREHGGIPVAHPLGSGSTVLHGTRLLAESILPWLVGPPQPS